MKNCYIAIDVGGSKINLAAGNPRKLLKKQTIKTSGTREEFLNFIIDYINKQKKDFNAKRVCLGIPGVFDKKREKPLRVPNVAYLENFPLKRYLEKKIKIPVILENDADCFGTAEYLKGAGKESRSVYCLTLGTGVGGCFILKNKIWRGEFGGAGEPEHTKFVVRERNLASLGDFCSKKFFTKRNLNSREIREKAAKNNKEALKIVNEYGYYLGVAISNIVNLLDPQTIILGGGLSELYPYFINQAKKTARENILSPLSAKNVKIKKGALGAFAGTIGALFIAEKNKKNEKI